MTDIIAASPAAGLPATEEATIQDLRLAEVLGYKRTTNIRNLIARHRTSLEAMGSLLQREAMIEAGKGATRTVTEFHLTKAQAAFLVAKAGTKEADSALILVAEAFAMLAEGKLVAVDKAAQAELDAAAERAAERRRLMREEKDDYSRIMKSFSRSPTRSVIGTNPDGSAKLKPLTPFEKKQIERERIRQRDYRLRRQGWKSRAPGDPTY